MAVAFTRSQDGLLIDGSSGEGGGQILRTSLALAAITRTRLTLTNIRAARPRPGLQRQHSVCVQAAAALCGAAVAGGEEGSTTLTFAPAAAPPPLAQSYAFDIGTAGASTLVLATILPILWARLPQGSAPIPVTITGGTHNPHAPSHDFLAATLLPLLARAGLRVDVACARCGFYPAGGGRLCATVHALPSAPPAPGGYALTAGGPVTAVRACLLATPSFPAAAAQAHVRALAAALGLPPSQVELRKTPAAGAAACALAWVERSAAETTDVCAAFSERRGQTSEQLAGELAGEVAALRATSAPISHWSADQLLLPLLLFSSGGTLRYSPVAADLHFATNVGVIEAFLGQGLVAVQPAGQGAAEVAVEGAAGGGGGGGGAGALDAGVLVTLTPRQYFAPAPLHAAAAAVAEGGAAGAQQEDAPVPAAALLAVAEGAQSPHKKARVEKEGDP